MSPASGSEDTSVAPPVILVDDSDRDIGSATKLEAHERGLLHRAVSVFAFDADGRLLLQRRAKAKYHSGGCWSNSACTHPRRDELLDDAARRCVREELGIECDALTRCLSFVYRAQVSPTLIEHELDHVFVARVTPPALPDPAEVEEWRLVTLHDVREELARDASRYSAWFPLALDRLIETPGALALVLGRDA